MVKKPIFCKVKKNLFLWILKVDFFCFIRNKHNEVTIKFLYDVIDTDN